MPLQYKDMEPEELLKKGAEAFAEIPGPGQLKAMMAHMRVLADWNTRINLTSINEEHDIILKHFVDSLSIMPFIRKEILLSEGSTGTAGRITVADIGSGAGFPGIPVAVMLAGGKKPAPSEIILIDSLNKRVRFLEEAVKVTGLASTEDGESVVTARAVTARTKAEDAGKAHTGIDDTGAGYIGAVCVRVVHARAEDAGRDPLYRDKADIVVARAVAAYPVLLEYCLPFVKKGGIFIAMKGAEYADEMAVSAKAIAALGGVMEDAAEFVLPFSDMKRVLVIVRKTAETPRAYPRKAGTPEKKPLV